MSAAYQFQREHFQIGRESEYFKRNELEKQTGQPARHFLDVLVKELVDNGLDAAETAGRLPEVAIEVDSLAMDATGAEQIRLAVSDNGVGISAAVIEKILDFKTRTSDKFYKSPSRGAQGNALKTVLGIPQALGAERSQVCIEAQGIRHQIIAWADPAGKVRTEHTTEGIEVTEGTRISVTVPRHAWLRWMPEHWAARFAVFNPHTRVKIQHRRAPCRHADDLETDEDDRADFYAPVNAEVISETKVAHYPPTTTDWKRHLPTDPTSVHWYSFAEFRELMYHYIGSKDITLRAFVEMFSRCKGSAKLKRIGDGLPLRLNDLDGDHAQMERLYQAMRAESAVINPLALGYIGKEHLLERVQCKSFGRHWYKRTAGVTQGSPFVVEVMVAESDHPATWTGVNFSPTFADPIGSWRLNTPEFIVYGLESFLSRCDATPEFGCAAVLHIVSPSLAFMDRGKTRLADDPEMRRAIEDALWGVCKHAFNAKEQRRKDARREAREAEQRHKDMTRALQATQPNMKTMTFAILPSAWALASGDDEYEVSHRDLYYKVRELLSQQTDRELDYDYFSQKLLTQYQVAHGAIKKLHTDPRGFLVEPHTGTTIPLGERQVESYEFPYWLYDKILFIEKKGRFKPLQQARIPERYDMAVVCAEGYSNVAARKLFAQAQHDRHYQLFVLHDCDVDGYNIARTLAESTARLPQHQIEVIDLGLSLAQVKALGLYCEEYTRTKKIPKALQLTDEEREFFTGQRIGTHYAAKRCELNALSAPQLVELVESGLKKHGADAKMIPPVKVCRRHADAAYSHTLRERIQTVIEDRLDMHRIISRAVEALPMCADTEKSRHWVVEHFATRHGRAHHWQKAIDAKITGSINHAHPTIENAALAALRDALSRGES